jgi:hypothetical protein
MFQLAGVRIPKLQDQPFTVIKELAILGFFFMMKSYENTITPKPDQTKLIHLGGLVFWKSLLE